MKEVDVLQIDGDDVDLTQYAKKATTLAGYGITDGATKEEVSKLSEEIEDKVDQVYVDDLAAALREEMSRPLSPDFVSSEAEMTDTSKAYINTTTGTIWIHKETTITTTIRDDIVGTTDNPYMEGRLPSSGTTPTAMSGYIISPYIDLTKEEYQGKTIKLHFEGLRYITETYEAYVQNQVLGTDRTTVLAQRTYSCQDTAHGNFTHIADSSEILDTNSAILTITLPKLYAGASQIGYLRFCAKGTEVESTIYITYEGETTGTAWVDTGMVYQPTVSDAEKQLFADEIVALIDTELVAVIGTGEVSV